MKTEFIGLRISSELMQLLAANGPVSTATQALACIGAASIGLDVSPLLADMTILGQRKKLAPVIQRALAREINKMLNIPLILFDEGAAMPTEPVEPMDVDDPFAGIGIEV